MSVRSWSAIMTFLCLYVLLLLGITTQATNLIAFRRASFKYRIALAITYSSDHMVYFWAKDVNPDRDEQVKLTKLNPNGAAVICQFSVQTDRGDSLNTLRLLPINVKYDHVIIVTAQYKFHMAYYMLRKRKDGYDFQSPERMVDLPLPVVPFLCQFTNQRQCEIMYLERNWWYLGWQSLNEWYKMEMKAAIKGINMKLQHGKKKPKRETQPPKCVKTFALNQLQNVELIRKLKIFEAVDFKSDFVDPDHFLSNYQAVHNELRAEIVKAARNPENVGKWTVEESPKSELFHDTTDLDAGSLSNSPLQEDGKPNTMCGVTEDNDVGTSYGTHNSYPYTAFTSIMGVNDVFVYPKHFVGQQHYDHQDNHGMVKHEQEKNNDVYYNQLPHIPDNSAYDFASTQFHQEKDVSIKHEPQANYYIPYNQLPHQRNLGVIGSNIPPDSTQLHQQNHVIVKHDPQDGPSIYYDDILQNSKNHGSIYCNPTFHDPESTPVNAMMYVLSTPSSVPQVQQQQMCHDSGSSSDTGFTSFQQANSLVHTSNVGVPNSVPQMQQQQTSVPQMDLQQRQY